MRSHDNQPIRWQYFSLQLKELLSKKMEKAPVAQQCLIFAGRILKDEETLEGQGPCMHVALQFCCSLIT